MPSQSQNATNSTPHDGPRLQVVPEGREQSGSQQKGRAPGAYQGATAAVEAAAELSTENEVSGCGFPVIDYDAALVDVDRLEELELMVQLMAAATAAPGRVPSRVVDQVLGVEASFVAACESKS